MKRNSPRWFFAVSVLLACVGMSMSVVAQPAVSLPPVSGGQFERLAGGEILVDASVNGSVMHGVVTAVVDAAPAAVWAVVSDFASQDRWVPDMADARIVRRDGQHVIGGATTRMPFPLRDRTWEIRIHNRAETVGGHEGFVSSWTFVQGSGNMLEHQGYWVVIPFPGRTDRTLVRYEFIVDPDVSAPDGVERRAMRRMLPGVMEGLRRRVTR